jgi:L-ribulose-5-phosphate 3-epimerase
VSGDFGLHWIEMRTTWNKNMTELNAKELEDAWKLLGEYKLQVNDFASPLFKTDWPGGSQVVSERKPRPVPCGLQCKRTG